MTGLSPKTKYYVKAYAINSIGTSYGSEVEVTTLPLTKKLPMIWVNETIVVTTDLTKYDTLNYETTDDATATIDVWVLWQDVIYALTAIASATDFHITGTPTEWQSLVIRLLDAWVTKDLTYDTVFRASSDLDLPTATTASAEMYLQFIYNDNNSTWDLTGKLDNFTNPA